jgi:tRNA G18 (ribose-2'-O)-methylase SpoU
MTTPLQRSETRRQRYNKKLKDAVILPVSMALVNFQKDANAGFAFRSACCFGFNHIHIIGSVPKRDVMNDLSGSTFDYVPYSTYSRPEDFIGHCRKNDIKIISFELPDEHFPAVELSEYKFDFSRESCLVFGHETIGVPPEILAHSDRVYIKMNGVGHCLNTSQTANIGAYVIAEQYKKYEQKTIHI